MYIYYNDNVECITHQESKEFLCTSLAAFIYVCPAKQESILYLLKVLQLSSNSSKYFKRSTWSTSIIRSSSGRLL